MINNEKIEVKSLEYDRNLHAVVHKIEKNENIKPG